MAIRSREISSLKKAAKKWEKGDKKNPKITGFLKLTFQQRNELKKHLDYLWNGGWSHQVPELIPGKLRHGYESRVQKDGFTIDQFIEWIRIAGSDTAQATIKLTLPKMVGLRANYTNKITGKNYPVTLTIKTDVFGSIHVDSVIPEGVWSPKDA